MKRLQIKYCYSEQETNEFLSNIIEKNLVIGAAIVYGFGLFLYVLIVVVKCELDMMK